MSIPSGVGQGGAFKLRPFQKRFIRALYEPHRFEGGQWRRLVRRAILSIARKNGKTALIAAIVLAHLIGPEAIPNGEIYSAANDRDQAAQVFKVARQIIEADPELAALTQIVPSTKTIVGLRTGSVYRAISSDAGRKHGLNPSVAIFDELAQAKSRELYDVLDTGFGARQEPLFIVISTQSNDPEHVLSKMIDDAESGADPSIICHLYAVPDDTPDIFSEKVWPLANPALGDFLSIAEVRAMAGKAQRMPAEEPKFRNLYLNQRVAPTASLLSRKEWMACAEGPDNPGGLRTGERVFMALDLSSTNDLTALVAGSEDDPTRIQAWFWKPEDLLKEHSDRDFGTNSGRYQKWRDDGFLLTTPGRSIDPAVIAQKIAELHDEYNIVGLAYDRWRIDTLTREFDRLGLATYRDDERGSGLRLIPWGQGYKDMTPAIDALEVAVIDRKLIHPRNEVLTWNVGNAVATMDPAGGRKLDKEKARFRIDGAVALAMMMGLKARDRMDEGATIDDYIRSLSVTE